MRRLLLVVSVLFAASPALADQVCVINSSGVHDADAWSVAELKMRGSALVRIPCGLSGLGLHVYRSAAWGDRRTPRERMRTTEPFPEAVRRYEQRWWMP